MASVLLSPKALKSTFLFISIAVLCFSLIVAHGGADDSDETVSHDSQPNLHSRALILVKVYCLIIVFVATFVFGISPYFYRWNESFLLLGTQFAGGVFLATAFIHFLGDSNSTFVSLGHDEYPYAFMLACAGYVLTMFADCIIHWVVTRGNEAKPRVDVEQANPAEEGHSKDIGMEVNPIFTKTTGLGDSILLIVALCFHSVFEGIAIGVSADAADAWRNLWTISLHKIFAAIAMGIALLKMMPTRPFLLTVAYSFAFAISSPIGIGIGIGIDATVEGSAADWTYAISMGIACGVFIYVAINHLIAKGYQPQKECKADTPFFKFLAVLLGVGVLAVVMIWD